MKLVRRSQYACISLLILFGLWSISFVPPIADDTQLISVGSGMIRTQGIGHLIREWGQFSLNSSHVTPVGGVITALHIWFVNKLALLDFFSLTQAWGIARVLWIFTAVIAQTLFIWAIRGRRMSPPLFALIGVIDLATVQIHGYWSNDPVMSYPIASWATMTIGFLFLTSLVLGSSGQSRGSRAVFSATAFALAWCGIFTYELFVGFMVAGIPLLPFMRQQNRRAFSYTLFLISPPLIIFALLHVLRMSEPSTYSGTEISIASSSIFRIGVVAILTSFPLANLRLTSKLLSDWSISYRYAFRGLISLGVLGLFASVFGISEIRRSENQISNLRLLASMSVLLCVATGIIVVTPKYQIELHGELGRVYTNYAAGWLALSTVIVILGVKFYNANLLSRIILPLLIVSIGFTQTLANSKQLAAIEANYTWSKVLIDAVDDKSLSNAARCEYLQTFSSLALPSYYIEAIATGVSNAYQGTNGRAFCSNS